jgi:hypothetical protein
MPQPVDDRIVSLPHWARVAFAGRCAEHSTPLFRSAWPTALPKHTAALEAAVRLTRESAANGVADAGLRDAVVEVVSTAEAALAIALARPANVESPDAQTACRISFSAARSAGSAGEAAMNGPEDSVRAATDAFASARQAAESAGSPTTLAGMEKDLESLIRLAKEKRWTDGTSVAPSAFLRHSEKPRRPWWKFWRLSSASPASTPPPDRE